MADRVNVMPVQYRAWANADPANFHIIREGVYWIAVNSTWSGFTQDALEPTEPSAFTPYDEVDSAFTL